MRHRGYAFAYVRQYSVCEEKRGERNREREEEEEEETKNGIGTPGSCSHLTVVVNSECQTHVVVSYDDINCRDGDVCKLSCAE